MGDRRREPRLRSHSFSASPSRRSWSARSRSGTGTASTPIAASRTRRARSSWEPLGGDRELDRLRDRRDRDRRWRRRSRSVRRRRPWRRKPGRAAHAPTRRLGGDARVRVRHRVRRGHHRLPLRAVDRARGTGARRDPVRRSHRRPDAARHRRARQREAAALLGASPACARREIDPRVAGRALAVAAGFAFAISLGNLGATVFLARPDAPTLPVAIFRFLGRPGRAERRAGVCAGRDPDSRRGDLVLAVECRLGSRRLGWF